MGSPAVAAGADARLVNFVAGTDGALWHMWQTAPNGDWSPWFSHGRRPGSCCWGLWRQVDVAHRPLTAGHRVVESGCHKS